MLHRRLRSRSNDRRPVKGCLNERSELFDAVDDRVLWTQKETRNRLLVKRQSRSRSRTHNRPLSSSQRVSKLNKAVWTLPSNIDNAQLRIMSVKASMPRVGASELTRRSTV